MRRLCRGGDGDGNANGTTTHHALWDNNDKENKPRFRVQGKLYCGNKAVMFKQWKHLAQQSLPPKRWTRTLGLTGGDDFGLWSEGKKRCDQLSEMYSLIELSLWWRASSSAVGL